MGKFGSAASVLAAIATHELGDHAFGSNTHGRRNREDATAQLIDGR
jgi:hypothetical protein